MAAGTRNSSDTTKTASKKSPNAIQKAESSGAVQKTQKKVRPFQEFFTKFNNDWSPNLASALAYNILMSIFPIVLAILAILGLFLGGSYQTAIDDQLKTILPKGPASYAIVTQITMQLSKNAGILGIIAIVLAIYNGSGLFKLIEGCFGIIYHVRQRKFIKQNLMAIGMLLAFIILIPILTLVSAAPALVISVLQQTPLLSFPGAGIVITLIGIAGGVLVAWIFFLLIYIVVPNQHISFRNSWKGALFAGIALDLYLILFPLYVSRFMGNYGGALSLVIVLIFFYYFALILLLGAEVNAFFSEGIRATPTDLVTMVHITTSHLPKTPEDKEKQAAASHKEQPTGTAAQKAHIDDAITPTLASKKNTQSPSSILTNAIAPDGNKHKKMDTQATQTAQTAYQTRVVDEVPHVQLEKPKPPSLLGTALEAIAGTALAFVAEFFFRRKK